MFGPIIFLMSINAGLLNWCNKLSSYSHIFIVDTSRHWTALKAYFVRVIILLRGRFLSSDFIESPTHTACTLYASFVLLFMSWSKLRKLRYLVTCHIKSEPVLLKLRALYFTFHLLTSSWIFTVRPFSLRTLRWGSICLCSSVRCISSPKYFLERERI